MNSSDVKWLEKVFEQYKDDQRIYLDDKFASLAVKLDERRAECKAWTQRCRTCVDSNMGDLSSSIDECKKASTTKAILGSAVAVFLTMLLWTAFGTDALHDIIMLIGSLF